MSLASEENVIKSDKGSMKKSKIQLSSFLESTGSVGDNLLEASVFSNSLKRKYTDDSDSVGGTYKKEEFDSSFCVSPWEYRRLKADLMESQAQRIKLEDRIDQLHKKNKETVIFFDKEKSEMKIQLESNRNTIKDLEFRLNKIRKREMECREELNERNKVSELMKLKLGEKIIKLEAENGDLKLKVNKLDSDHDESVFKFHEEIRNLKNENEKFQLMVAEKETVLANMNVKLSSALDNSKKYEEVQNQLYIAQLKIKELECEKEEFKEAKSVTMALSEKALRVPELEKELNDKKQQISNLKQFLNNNIMLEEMVHDLKTKLAAVEGKEIEVPNLKAKIVQLESELEKWISIATDFTNEPSRETLRDYIELLQRKELTNSLEINCLGGNIKTSESKLMSLQHELESSKTHNSKLQSNLQKLKIEVQLLRKKTVLISRERDSYRQQLDLYERDLTLTGLPIENPTNDTVNQMRSRLQNLEISLGEYRKHIEALESQLKEYQEEEPCENIEKICKLKEEVKNLVDANRILRQQKDELEQKLETRAARGEFLMPDTKILHFRNNPTFEAEKKQLEDMNQLREECDRLRARVKLLESGEIMDITQKVSEDVKNFSSQKTIELEKELQSANLKMQRLKEVFKKTSQDFRDVSYMLLGYRIDLASNSKLYKLYNMYSTSPMDFLMFQQTKKGTMEMLGTTFAESMPKLVDEYLHKGNSIPAFLSAVTLELYGLSAQSDDDNDMEEDVVITNNVDEEGEDDDDDEEEEDESEAEKNSERRVKSRRNSIEAIEID
ncbi:hypothetical protein RUM43_013373 [Polyplax serrata]|uniref:Mitotic spindle assembly checkpoint protein MAD1 n=1 Tax=Polyplax serrata TaxID=468196 RepID=A0AAN8Q2Q5_POLSC